MESISIQAEDQLEGTPNFSNWKGSLSNKLEENFLDKYISTVMEEPSSNAGWTIESQYASFVSLFQVTKSVNKFLSNHEESSKTVHNPLPKWDDLT